MGQQHIRPSSSAASGGGGVGSGSSGLDGDPSKPHVYYIDTSGLGTDTLFYMAPELEVQLLMDTPVWTFHNQKSFLEDAEEPITMFVGETDDSKVYLNLLRYYATTGSSTTGGGRTVVTGMVHDRSTDLFYQILPNHLGQDTVRITSEDDLPPLGEPWDGPLDSVFSPPDEQEDEGFLPSSSLMRSSWNQIMSHASSYWSSLSSLLRRASNTITEVDVIVDVMVIWTENSECDKSTLGIDCTLDDTTRTNMEAAVTLMIQETNVALSNSATHATLNLVHLQRESSGYRESSMTTTLSQITDTDGTMDYIQDLRDQYKADLVQFIVDNRIDSDNLGGVGWLPAKNVFGCYDAQRGFSCICAQCMVNYISAHEFGHNLGCYHDRGTMNQCTGSVGSMSCETNYGYRSPSGSWRTVMAYQCKSGECDGNPGTSCPRIPYYSGGDGQYNGEARGGSDNNCGGEISQRKQDIANYRT